MTRSKNTNKQIDNPEFLKIFMQESFQEFLEQEIAVHLGALPYERTANRRGEQCQGYKLLLRSILRRRFLKLSADPDNTQDRDSVIALKYKPALL